MAYVQTPSPFMSVSGMIPSAVPVLSTDEKYMERLAAGGEMLKLGKVMVRLPIQSCDMLDYSIRVKTKNETAYPYTSQEPKRLKEVHKAICAVITAIGRRNYAELQHAQAFLEETIDAFTPSIGKPNDTASMLAKLAQQNEQIQAARDKSTPK